MSPNTWFSLTELSSIWSLRSGKTTEKLVSSSTDEEMASWIPRPETIKNVIKTRLYSRQRSGDYTDTQHCKQFKPLMRHKYGWCPTVPLQAASCTATSMGSTCATSMRPTQKIRRHSTTSSADDEQPDRFINGDGSGQEVRGVRASVRPTRTKREVGMY